MPNNISEKLGPERVAVGWPWRLVLFSLLVLVTVIVVYLGLELGYKIYLNSQIKNKDEAIQRLSQSISQEEQKRFIDFYSQLANLQRLLDDHVFISKVSPFLEANTNRLVYYDFVDLRLKERRLDLGGVAQSYGVFAQQLEAFNRAPEVERLAVNESQSVGNAVKFRAYLILKPAVFK